MGKRDVHTIVAQWMRRTMHEHGWTAGEWATRAGTSKTNITRVVNPTAGEEPIVPNLSTIYMLAQVAGTQPDLIGASRKPVTLVPVVRQRMARHQRELARARM